MGTFAGGALADWLGRKDARWRQLVPALGMALCGPTALGAWLAPSLFVCLPLLAAVYLLGLLYFAPTFAAAPSDAPRRSCCSLSWAPRTGFRESPTRPFYSCFAPKLRDGYTARWQSGGCGRMAAPRSCELRHGAVIRRAHTAPFHNTKNWYYLTKRPRRRQHGLLIFPLNCPGPRSSRRCARSARSRQERPKPPAGTRTKYGPRAC